MPRDLYLVLCMAIGGFFAGRTAPVKAQQTQPSPTTRPAIAIYVEISGMSERAFKSGVPAGPDLILAAWEDGQIIWSAKPNGGPPYLAGRFDPKSLTQLTDDLGKRGAFENKALAGAHYGPDSSYTVIRIDSGQRRLELQSWHELFEQNPKLVATAGGIMGLDGRDREEVLREQPAWYREFRAVWSEIRTTTKSWIPRDGKAWEGTLSVEHGAARR